jgi:hypothetical protein
MPNHRGVEANSTHRTRQYVERLCFNRRFLIPGFLFAVSHCFSRSEQIYD